MMRPNLVPSESVLPDLKEDDFFLCLHMVERGDHISPVSFYKGTDVMHEGSTLMTSQKPKQLPKTLPPYTIAWWYIGTSLY